MIPKAALNLIIQHESNALRPYVPKNSPSSGVTLGIGYDMAHQSKHEIARDWVEHLPADDVQLLQLATSLIGSAAEDYCRDNLGHVRITADAGVSVFERSSLPKYEGMTVRAFPNVKHLHPLCYGALVSLVFNRGPGMGARNTASWDTRREMRELQQAMAEERYNTVPILIRSMKRLWEGKGLAGLLRRRDDEAAMFEQGLQEMV